MPAALIVSSFKEMLKDLELEREELEKEKVPRDDDMPSARNMELLRIRSFT